MSVEAVISGAAKWAVIHGDVRDVLKTLPAAAFDFCLSDVPYGLGAREPTAAEIIAYLQGEGLDTRGDFMGRRWSIPSVGVWLEVSRCLKPGAHVFSFGGTRTWDLISLGLRAAGFENRDTIAADFPALRWDQSQGSVKSANVERAIDMHLCDKPGRHCMNRVPANDPQPDDHVCDSTPDGKAHEAEGTALAPSWEPVLVFRKPLEGTIAENVLAHGTGTLQIDSCRTFTAWNEPDRPESWKRSGHTANDDAEKIAAPTGQGIDCNPLGRWPKNRVLIHAEGCRRVGSKKVAGRGDRAPGGNINSGVCYAQDAYTKAMKRSAYNGPASPDGTETVDDWRCVDGCPAKALNDQAGFRKGPGTPSSGSWAGGGLGYGGTSQESDRRRTGYEPEGGTCSRFFPQFQAEVPFNYVAKASRTEREFGCESLPSRKSAEVTGRDEDAPGHNNPRSGSRRRGEIKNTGPCVKPQAFLRWLVRLGCRPGGVVLVPYCGTGSEIIACVGAGMRAIGIEADAEMVAIANARCTAWELRPGGPTVEAREEIARESAGQAPLFGGATR